MKHQIGLIEPSYPPPTSPPGLRRQSLLWPGDPAQTGGPFWNSGAPFFLSFFYPKKKYLRKKSWGKWSFLYNNCQLDRYADELLGCNGDYQSSFGRTLDWQGSGGICMGRVFRITAAYNNHMKTLLDAGITSIYGTRYLLIPSIVWVFMVSLSKTMWQLVWQGVYQPRYVS